jgi:hypothetical protein
LYPNGYSYYDQQSLLATTTCFVPAGIVLFRCSQEEGQEELAKHNTSTSIIHKQSWIALVSKTAKEVFAPAATTRTAVIVPPSMRVFHP